MIPVYLKVHLTPKYFLHSNKSLHLFDTHCAFLPIFNPNLDFLQAVKSGHHLVHDRVSKGYGSIPGLTSQTSLHACLQRLNMMQISLWHQTRNRPIPLTSSVVWQMMTWFRIFYNLKKKSRLSLKRRSAFRTDAKIYLSEKKYFGVTGRCTWSVQNTRKCPWLKEECKECHMQGRVVPVDTELKIVSNSNKQVYLTS